MSANNKIFLNCHGSAYLNSLVEESGLTTEEVYNRSGLMPFFPYVFKDGRRIPTKDTLIQLSFGLSLSIHELNGMLDFFGYAPLNESIHREAAILTALSRGIGFAQTQTFLAERGFPPLGMDKQN